MTDDGIEIRELADDDLEAVVAFSLRAWEPVFASLQEVLGEEIFLRLHPDWRRAKPTPFDRSARTKSAMPSSRSWTPVRSDSLPSH